MRAVLINSWGDHSALPLTDEFLSLVVPFCFRAISTPFLPVLKMVTAEIFLFQLSAG